MQSPFAHVLFTNYAPTATEAVRIREFCSEPEAELARLNSEISRLQQALDNLTSQRDEIQDTVDSHRALLHPIRNVPPEIIQHIFVLCLDAKRNPVMHESEAPLLLGRICRSWREICMGTAELWSSIHIVAPDVSENAKGMTNNATRTIVDRVVDWLKRSGDLPLSISLFVQPSVPHPPPSDLIYPSPSILKVILSHSSRWRCVTLNLLHVVNLNRELELGSLDDRLGSSFPLLEKFLCLGNPWLRALAFLETAPRLRQLSLLHCEDVHFVRIPWSQLTELRVESFAERWDEIMCLQVLESCTSLRRCALVYTPREDIIERRLTLPHLHSLRIQSTAGDDPQTRSIILDYLTLPSLRELQLQTSGDFHFIPAIINLLTRSSCSLEKLVLKPGPNYRVEANELLACFSHVPELRELSFSLPPSLVWDASLEEFTASLEAQKTLTALSPSSGQDQALHMCPKLRHIVIHGMVAVHNLETIISFLHSRVNPIPGVARMNTIHLHFISNLGRGERADIEQVGRVHSTRVGFREDGHAHMNSWELEKPEEEIIVFSPMSWLDESTQESSRWTGLQDDGTDVVCL